MFYTLSLPHSVTEWVWEGKRSNILYRSTKAVSEGDVRDMSPFIAFQIWTMYKHRMKKSTFVT